MLSYGSSALSLLLKISKKEMVKFLEENNETQHKLTCIKPIYFEHLFIKKNIYKNYQFHYIKNPVIHCIFANNSICHNLTGSRTLCLQCLGLL